MQSSWKVNGLEFLWKDRSGYRKGDYRLVHKIFEPYFQFLSIGGEHHAISAERNSDGMFGDNNGDSAYYGLRVLAEHSSRFVVSQALPIVKEQARSQQLLRGIQDFGHSQSS
jgi:hypothetical protein